MKLQTYQWRSSYLGQSKVDANTAGKFLETLETRGELLKTETILDAARPIASPIHGLPKHGI